MTQKIFLIALTALLLLSLCGAAAAADTIYVNEALFIHIGSGATLNDANGVSVTWSLDAAYILVENVNMVNVNGGVFSPIGDSTTQFEGTFDGRGFTISNLVINEPTGSDIGLFGNATNALFKNIILVNADITGLHHVGILLGSGSGGNVTIENCSVSGNVEGDSNVGGLAGDLDGSISNSYAVVDVIGLHCVGGLVGALWSGSSISNSYAIGDVTGVSIVGGLVGNLYGSISNSYATGDVTGTSNIGGLVGNADASATISNSYAIGDVTGTNSIGGLVGIAVASATISNSFFRTESIGYDNGYGTSTPDADLKKIATFSNAGWSISSAPDNTKIWHISEDLDYPKLYFAAPPAPATSKGGGGFGSAAIVNNTTVPDNRNNTTNPDVGSTTPPSTGSNTTPPSNASSTTPPSNASNTTPSNENNNTESPKSKTAMIVLIILGVLVVAGAAVVILRQKKKI